MYSAAKSLGISETTLRERNKGRQSRRLAYVSQQILSDSEETALAKWITTLTLTRLPPSYPVIKTMVEAIQADRVASINITSSQLVSYPPIGEHWASHFIQRHPHL